jgi:hypothetical protein
MVVKNPSAWKQMLRFLVTEMARFSEATAPSSAGVKMLIQQA